MQGKHSGVTSKLRTYEADIKAMQAAGKRQKEIAVEMSKRIGATVHPNAIYYFISTIQPQKRIKIVWNLRQDAIYKERGILNFTKDGVAYTVEKQQFCCKAFKKAFRRQNKITANFKVCPFCQAPLTSEEIAKNGQD